MERPIERTDKSADKIIFSIFYFAVTVLFMVWYFVNYEIAKCLAGNEGLLLRMVALFVISVIFTVSYYHQRFFLATSIVLLTLAFVVISPFVGYLGQKNYVVIVKNNGYEVIKGGLAFIDPLTASDIERVSKVPLQYEEGKFYEIHTGSYHFLKLRISLKLRSQDNDTIFLASQDRYPGIKYEVSRYIIDKIQFGIDDKESLIQDALNYFSEKPQGPWVVSKIEILSLQHVQ